MKDLTNAFQSHMTAMRNRTASLEFVMECTIDWTGTDSVTYSPADHSEITQSPFQDDNEFKFVVPDTSGNIKDNVRRKVHAGKPVKARISFDGGITWDEGAFSGTIDDADISKKDFVEFSCVGWFGPLDNTVERLGSGAWQRKFVDSSDGFFDEVGDSKADGKKKLGSRV